MPFKTEAGKEFCFRSTLPVWDIVDAIWIVADVEGDRLRVPPGCCVLLSKSAAGIAIMSSAHISGLHPAAENVAGTWPAEAAGQTQIAYSENAWRNADGAVHTAAGLQTIYVRCSAGVPVAPVSVPRRLAPGYARARGGILATIPPHHAAKRPLFVKDEGPNGMWKNQWGLPPPLDARLVPVSLGTPQQILELQKPFVSMLSWRGISEKQPVLKLAAAVGCVFAQEPHSPRVMLQASVIARRQATATDEILRWRPCVLPSGLIGAQVPGAAERIMPRLQGLEINERWCRRCGIPSRGPACAHCGSGAVPWKCKECGARRAIRIATSNGMHALACLDCGATLAPKENESTPSYSHDEVHVHLPQEFLASDAPLAALFAHEISVQIGAMVRWHVPSRSLVVPKKQLKSLLPALNQTRGTLRKGKVYRASLASLREAEPLQSLSYDENSARQLGLKRLPQQPTLRLLDSARCAEESRRPRIAPWERE